MVVIAVIENEAVVLNDDHFKSNIRFLSFDVRTSREIVLQTDLRHQNIQISDNPST